MSNTNAEQLINAMKLVTAAADECKKTNDMAKMESAIKKALVSCPREKDATTGYVVSIETLIYALILLTRSMHKDNNN